MAIFISCLQNTLGPKTMKFIFLLERKVEAINCGYHQNRILTGDRFVNSEYVHIHTLIHMYTQDWLNENFKLNIRKNFFVFKAENVLTPVALRTVSNNL
jgi:hypothetical protein